MKKIMLNKLIPIIIIIVFAICSFFSCNDKAVDIDMYLVSTKDTIFLNDIDTIDVFKISVNTHHTSQYKITQYPHWLSVSSVVGQTNRDSICVELKRSDLKSGVTKGTISVISDDAGTIEIPVIYTKREEPRLKFNMNEIDFKDNVEELDLIITNNSFSVVVFSINKTVDWLTADIKESYLYGNEQKVIKLGCRRDLLDQNSYETSLTVLINYLIPIQIPVKMIVPQLSTMKLNPSKLEFNYFENEKTFSLKNIGNTAYTWEASGYEGITITPHSGTLNKGDSTDIKISYDRHMLLENGTYKSVFSIANSNGYIVNQEVVVKHFIEKKWLLNKSIVAADFCRSTNRIITVSKNPNIISIIDPESKSMVDYDLAYEPQCLSVSTNGNIAVVGHDMKITFLDIHAGTTKVHNTSYNASSIAVSNSGSAYITPKNGQWKNAYSTTTLTCLGMNIYTGVEYYNQLGNSWSMYCKVSPIDNIMYYVEDNWSFVKRYDISGSKVSHGKFYIDERYSLGSNFWFSENGDRIFTGGKQVLKADYVHFIDRIPNGTINCTGFIKSLFHVQSTRKIYLINSLSSAINAVGGNTVLEYKFDDLDFVKSYNFEDYVIKNSAGTAEFKTAESHYVFGSVDGRKLYILTAMGMPAQSWAIQTIETK